MSRERNARLNGWFREEDERLVSFCGKEEEMNTGAMWGWIGGIAGGIIGVAGGIVGAY